jgi:tripartite-type tricarboxylate transporter receptor subunit TctC
MFMGADDTLARAEVIRLQGFLELQGFPTVRALLLVLALALLPAFGASGEEYPSKPIRLVVGGAVGGGWDLASRLLAEQMRRELGQPVIVENRAGADGALAASAVAQSAPDGYTLMPSVSAQMVMAPVLREKVSYDPIRNFEPVSLIGLYPLVLVVNPSVPAGTVREFVAHARANPGRLNYAAGSAGFVFATERFREANGIDVRRIPYKGSAQAVTALLAGDVQMAIVDLPPALAHVRAGKLKALAVTSAKRVAQIPDVPTLAESGGLADEIVLWSGMFAPAGTPPAVIARLQSAIAASLEAPETREKLVASGIVPASSTPQALGERLRRDLGMVRDMAKAGVLSAD